VNEEIGYTPLPGAWTIETLTPATADPDGAQTGPPFQGRAQRPCAGHAAAAAIAAPAREHRQRRRGRGPQPPALNQAAVAASAGKKLSMRISCRVTSWGVPSVAIDVHELAMLLEGIEVARAKTKPRWEPPARVRSSAN
jgi:hypothetical protein